MSFAEVAIPVTRVFVMLGVVMIILGVMLIYIMKWLNKDDSTKQHTDKVSDNTKLYNEKSSDCIEKKRKRLHK